jgi:exopolysaccharide biosynthesis polyprenyl glycosylphosphotransferase
LADAASVALTLFLGAVLLGDDHLTFAAIGAVAMIIVVMKVIGLYDRDEHLLRPTTLDEVPALFQISTLIVLLLWLVGDFLVDGDLGRRQVLGMWVLLLILLIVGRSVARFLSIRLTNPERCLMIGDSETTGLLRRKLNLDGSRAAEVVGWIPSSEAGNGSGNGSVSELPKGLYRILAEQQVHRVVLAPGRVDSETLLNLVEELSAMQVSVSIMPATPSVAGSSVERDDIHGLTLLGARGFQISRSSRILKRSFDLVTSSALLLLLSPLMLAIAAAIRLDSPGSILFRQRRIGGHDNDFMMFKFRSMYEGSEHLRDDLRELNEADGLFKIEADPRITRVGKWIRRWSLDELPQLFNVLRGEMSLVGPRPLVPDEDSQIVGLYRRRLDIAPGITGYWQSLGSSRIPLSEMVRLDYLYVATWSLWHDVRILLRTVPYVVGGRGR